MEETVGPLDLCLPKGDVEASMDGTINDPLDLCLSGNTLDPVQSKSRVSDSLQSRFQNFELNLFKEYSSCNPYGFGQETYSTFNRHHDITLNKDKENTLQIEEESSKSDKGYFSLMDTRSPLYKVNAGEDVQVCSVCGGKFPTLASLLLHMKDHIDVLECVDCGVWYASNSQLNRHSDRNPHSSSWKCSLCRAGLRDAQYRKEYRKTYYELYLNEFRKTHLETPQFSSVPHNEHMLHHTVMSELGQGRSLYKNLIFNRSPVSHFESIQGYSQNSVSDSEGKFKCNDCGKTFARGRNVLIHRNYGRCPVRRDAKIVFACSDCGKKCLCEKDLIEHKAEHLSQDGKGFPCRDCGKVFLRKTALHIHTGSRRCTGAQKDEKSNNHCPECGLVFKFRAHLVEHMVKHTGERAFQCNGCGKWFARARNVKMHIQRGSCVGGFLNGKMSHETVKLSSVQSHSYSSSRYSC